MMTSSGSGSAGAAGAAGETELNSQGTMRLSRHNQETDSICLQEHDEGNVSPGNTLLMHPHQHPHQSAPAPGGTTPMTPSHGSGGTPGYNNTHLAAHPHLLNGGQGGQAGGDNSHAATLHHSTRGAHPSNRSSRYVRHDWDFSPATSTQTSRERHKSAPYLRLKNSKRTSKCQIFTFTVPENPKVGPN